MIVKCAHYCEPLDTMLDLLSRGHGAKNPFAIYAATLLYRPFHMIAYDY